MKRAIVLLAAFLSCVAGTTAYAIYAWNNTGTWPKTWPAELEPLRGQARSIVGGTVEDRIYEIPFTKRAEFESVWPAMLKVKSKGAPIILVRGPYTFVGAHVNAGVVVHCPPINADARNSPETPIPGQNNPRRTWARTTFIELIVDGDVVDLNRVPLPPETPIIDERFKSPDKGEAGHAAPPPNPAGAPEANPRPTTSDPR